MSWLFSHKLLFLLIIAGVWYWVKNPPDRFGIARPGIVVYNRIPVFLLDLYISPSGKLYLEGDLSKKENIVYWFDKHLPETEDSRANVTNLLVGTGFAGKRHITFDQAQTDRLRDKKIMVKFMPSMDAVRTFNSIRHSGGNVMILLIIK